MKQDETPKPEHLASPSEVTGGEEMPSTNLAAPLASRRQFVKGAVAAAPVILTLASRPAWGSVCSPSGLCSGNASVAGDPLDCQTGKPPEYWRDELTNLETETFVDLFDVSEPRSTLAVVLGVDVSVGVRDSLPGYTWQQTQFLQFAIAAYYNAYTGRTPYITTAQVTEMVEAVWPSGEYCPGMGCIWETDHVADYFESTFRDV